MSGRTLTIVNVAYPFAPVGPDAVGGAEQILTRIDEALVAAGHRSLVIASEGSSVAGQLIPIPSFGSRLTPGVRAAANRATRHALQAVLSRSAVDLVHFHGLDFAAQLPPIGPPVLITLHLPVHAYPPSAFQIDRPDTFLHCVSASQHASLPAMRTEVLPPIPNGVPIDRLRAVHATGDYTAALGRICPEKGFHLAAQAARKAGLPLVLGGQVFAYPTHEQYFREILGPLVDAQWLRFVGPLRRAQKEALLRSARCLLIPSQVPETSSLVAMEAASVGTPVVAFRAGALPEVVEHGRTGLLVDSVEEMAGAIHAVSQFDRVECHAVARERFSADAMAARYLARYAQLVSTRAPSRNSQGPADVSGLTITEVTSLSGMQAMRDEWCALWQRSGDSIFQHPDWLIPWCRPFHVSEPWLLRLQVADRLVGVVPLVIYPRDGERVLTLLGAGISDDQDVLIEPDQPDAAMSAVWQYLADHAARWDVLELENLRESSPLVRSAPVGWHPDELRKDGVRPVLTFGPHVKQLDDLHAPDLVKDTRYRTRRAQREHFTLRFEDVNEDNFERLFAALVSLHRMRWNARGESGMLSDELGAFHREAAQRLLGQGLLRLHLLSFNGRPAAASYGYFAAGRSVFYLGGFDTELATFSPGKLVVAHAINYAITRDRAHSFDFLRGAESYKYLWGATDQPLYRRVLRCAPEPGHGARNDHAA